MGADLRVCARCEWIWKVSETDIEICPLCGFGSYGAHYVYGKKAYDYAVSQEPWKQRKITNYTLLINREVERIKRQEENKQLLYESRRLQTRRRQERNENDFNSGDGAGRG